MNTIFAIITFNLYEMKNILSNKKYNLKEL